MIHDPVLDGNADYGVIKLTAMLRQASLTAVAFVTMDAFATYAELRQIEGQGESAALALAEDRHLAIASGEKRVFRLEAIERLGAERIVTTADVFAARIRVGAITIDEPDSALPTLTANRFTLPFASRREVL